MNSPIKFADENKAFSSAELTPDGYLYHNTPFGNITGELTGECQQKTQQQYFLLLNSFD